MLSLANLTLQSDLDTTVNASGAATIRGNVSALGAYHVTGIERRLAISQGR